LKHVIYHQHCYDGWGAAWAAKKAMTDAILLPGVYGNPIPEVPDGADVWMIDISYVRPEMDALAQRVNLRVLDHHKTAQAALEGFPNCVFDMSKSGAMLAWEEFFPGQPAPVLIEYVQDQDLWNWKLPFSQEVCSYIRSYPRTMSAWDQLETELNHDDPSCYVLDPGLPVQAGAAIMRSEAQRVEEMCEQVQWLTIGSYIVPVVNASVQFSAVGNELCKKHPQAAFAAYYFDRGDGQRQWGLRSIGDFDVSEIAKLYGGGGHKNASGFQTKVVHEH
jgi:uncharacterized protein